MTCSFLLIAFLLSMCVANAADPKYAYVAMYYPRGKLSKSDYIGIRTMYRSFLKVNSIADFVVVTTKDTNEGDKRQLMDDGMRVMVMKLTNPYTQRSIQPDYKKMMNIIALWNLTDYKRVIFVDFYTIFHENFDSLFNCSYLCLKDEQPLVSPVSAVFRRSIRMT